MLRIQWDMHAIKSVAFLSLFDYNVRESGKDMVIAWFISFLQL